MYDLKVGAFIFNVLWFSCVLTFETWGGGCDVCWEVALIFFFAVYGTLALHGSQGCVSLNLSYSADMH